MSTFQIILSAFLLVAISANGQVINFESQGNLQTTNPLDCVSALTVKPTSTAADITAGAKACAQQSKYDQAAELIMVASAYAYFDTLRVSDKTAHGALTALFSKEFGSMQETERNELFASIDALDGDEQRIREICDYLVSSTPPSYVPDYMIAHGMGAFTDSIKEPLVRDFDASEGWTKSMVFVKCSS